MDNQLTIKQVLDLLNNDIADINADIVEIGKEFTKIFVFASSVSGFPLTGDTSHLYIDTTNHVVYYWSVEDSSYQSTKGADDIPLADATHNGLFSSTDFVKLGAIAEEATRVQPSQNNGSIIINGTEDVVFDYTKIPDASVTTKGLMTTAQSAKLIGISDEATKVQNSTTAGNIVIDGTEVNVFSVNDIPNATVTNAGLMTALNVSKLEGIATGATKTEKSKVNGNILINGIETTVFTAGGGDIPLASATEDGLQSKENFVKQGTVAIGATKTEKSNVNGNIRINDAEVKVFDPSQLPVADADNNGFMTAENYTKLVGIAPSATNTTGSKTVGNIVVNGTETKVFNVSDIPSASTTVAGLMPTTAVTKLASIADNATVVEASETNGNIVIDGAETKVFDATQIPDASATVKGYFTPSGFNKLAGIATGATVTAKSTTNGNILINGVETQVYTPSGTSEEAETAKKLSTPRAFSIAGDVTATPVNFDGTANVTLNAVLKTLTNIGVGVKPTVNDKGLVTKLEVLAVSDIPDLPNTKITGLGTASTKNVGSTAGDVVMLGENGLINVDLIPPMEITKVYEANSEEAMLALSATVGSVCVRTDIAETYILKAEPASTLANWVKLPHPSDAVTSVNGQIGAVVLTTSNVTEGTNQYFTTARATSNFNTNIRTTASTVLTDGATLVHKTDLATADANGLMSSDNFTKLAGISAGATKVDGSSITGNIKVDGQEVHVFNVNNIPDGSPTSKGLLTPAQATKLNGIATGATKVSASETAGHIMINDIDTAVFEVSDIPDASTTVKGLMGTTMVSKLNGIVSGATKVEASTTLGNIKINGTETKVFNLTDIPVASSTQNGLMSSANSQFLALVNGFYTSTTTKPTVLHVNTRSTATTNNTGSIYQPFTTVASAVAYAVAQGITGYYIVIDDANVLTDTELTTLTGCNAVISHNAPVNISQTTFNLGNTRLIADIVGVTNANCTIKSEIKTFKMVVSGNVVLGQGGNLFVDEFVGAQTTTFTVGVADDTSSPFINILQGQNIDWGSQITLVKQPSLGSRIGYLYYGLTAQS